MLLIADSGSTKTDWRLVDAERKITQFRTAGLNPYHIGKDDMAAVIANEFKKNTNTNAVTEIFFYGAGCANEEKCSEVAEAIRQTFPKASIHVDHDLLAAARALCGKEKGIAAILGTGSNSCLYDGEKVTAHVPSLGYVLADEGSGVHIGKRFLKSFLYDELPADLKKKILEKNNITIDAVLENIYRKPQPNRYIASFSDIVHKNISHPFLIQLVYSCFEEFLIHHIDKYKAPQPPEGGLSTEASFGASPPSGGRGALPLHAVGSIAYFYGDIFKAAAKAKGISVGRILQSPVAGLVLYHVGEVK